MSARPWLTGLLVLLSLPAMALEVTTLQEMGGDATSLAQVLVGQGIMVSNASYRGSPVAAGRFRGGMAGPGSEAGVVLSAGDVRMLTGGNKRGATSTDFGRKGDSDLDALVGGSSHDAAVLSFDFVPAQDALVFRYVFGSEEYHEYLDTPFNDAFGFFVNGQNCAVNGGQPVSIHTINLGAPKGVNPRNPALFRDNDFQNGQAPLSVELDGLTVVLNCVAAVRPGQVNHLKLVIADMQDGRVDTAVFVEMGSMRSRPMGEVEYLRGNPAGAGGGVQPTPPPPPPPPPPSGVQFNAPPTLTLTHSGAQTGITYQGQLDLHGVQVTGTATLGLSTDFGVVGQVLEVQIDGVWLSLGAPPITLPVAAGDALQLPVRLRSGRCGRAVSGAFAVQVAGVAADGQSQSRALPFSVTLPGHGWLYCLWPWLIGAAVLVLVALFMYGWVAPSRFPRGLTIVLSPEADLGEGAVIPLRGVRGTGSGFYRDARAFICTSFAVRGHAGADALVRLRADCGRVRIAALAPGQVQRRAVDGGWEPLPTSEVPVAPGWLYCNEAGTLFFAIRYQHD